MCPRTSHRHYSVDLEENMNPVPPHTAERLKLHAFPVFSKILYMYIDNLELLTVSPLPAVCLLRRRLRRHKETAFIFRLN